MAHQQSYTHLPGRAPRRHVPPAASHRFEGQSKGKNMCFFWSGLRDHYWKCTNLKQTKVFSWSIFGSPLAILLKYQSGSGSWQPCTTKNMKLSWDQLVRFTLDTCNPSRTLNGLFHSREHSGQQTMLLATSAAPFFKLLSYELTPPDFFEVGCWWEASTPASHVPVSPQQWRPLLGWSNHHEPPYEWSLNNLNTVETPRGVAPFNLHGKSPVVHADQCRPLFLLGMCVRTPGTTPNLHEIPGHVGWRPLAAEFLPTDIVWCLFF